MQSATVDAFNDELEKIAIFGHLLLGPVGHVAVNAMGRAAHHSSNLGSYLAHKGLQHGLTGSQIHPLAQRSIRALAGPEALANYDTARGIASKVQHLPTPEQHGLFSSALNTTSHPELHGAPVVGPLRDAFQHELHGTSPQLQSKGMLAGLYSKVVSGMGKIVQSPFDTTAQRVAKGAVGAAPMAAAATLDPIGTAAHMGINTTREIVGNSSIGKKAIGNLFERGIAGQKIHPAMETAVDYAVSPAVLDPLRLGGAIRKASPEHAQTVSKHLPAIKAHVAANPQMLQQVQTSQAPALQSLRQRLTPQL